MKCPPLLQLLGVPRCVAVLLALRPILAHAASPVLSCEQLAKFVLPQATITAVESIGAGQYTVPGRPEPSGLDVAGRAQPPTNPAFCRFAATLKPSKDSAIRLEVWLPQANWNGKFLAIGNFGWGGDLRYPGMLSGLAEGYATASNDTGHDSSTPEGAGGRFSLGHPQKLIDYAYRADHAMTLDAKALIKAFYGRAPARSYWVGCSLGGLEGLIEAKRYPRDFDGIVAGAPPNPITRFNAAQLWPAWLVSQDASRLIPKEKYRLIHEAALKSCATQLGREDGVIDEPDHCHFDPVALACPGVDAADCLTAAQVLLMQQIYAGPSNPRTGESIFPGPARGSELDVGAFAGTEAMSVALDLFRYSTFQDPNWNWRAMNWSRDFDTANQRVGPLLQVDSDLKAFFDHGGKLLLYIGWNDYHNPEELAGYYERLIQHSGASARAATRLFTIPGMGHCTGGAGCDTFSKLGAIDAWVDHGTAPERLVAARIEDGKVVRTRPLCAYPLVARYNGSGDTNEANNFSCTPE
jgi:feruloyl esterase